MADDTERMPARWITADGEPYIRGKDVIAWLVTNRDRDCDRITHPDEREDTRVFYDRLIESMAVTLMRHDIALLERGSGDLCDDG